MKRGAPDRSRLAWLAGLLGISGFVLLHGVYMSWSWIQRPFWQDECRHNYAVLNAVSLPAMIADIGFMGQPALDHVLRRVFWFPVFGHQEFGMRLPSLVAYVAMVLSGILIAARVLRRRGHPVAYALFGSLLIGLWMTTKPMEPWNAFEARHYALISLCSLWWFALAVLAERPAGWRWWGTSLLFANTHFFALPLIGAVGMLDAQEAWRRRGRRAALLVLAGTAAVWAATLALNGPAWRSITGGPPGGQVGRWAGLVSGCQTYWEFIRYIFRTPELVVLVWAGLLLALRRRDNRRLLLCCLGFMPLFLVALRMKSDYLFAPRYFTPFFGAAFVTLLLGLDQGPGLLARVSRRLRLGPPRARAARWLCLVGLFFLFKVGAAGMHLTRVRERWVSAGQNGSPTFQLYEAVKRLDRPVLVISELCFNDVTHLLYLRFVGEPFRWEVRLLRASACGESRRTITGGIAQFLADRPGGVVVLDQTDTGETVCGPPRVTAPRAGLVVRRAPAGQCAWIVEGVRTPDELRHVARAAEFRSLDWWARP